MVEELDLVCFIPIMLVYSALEVKRGWQILIKNEDSYNLAVQARLFLIKTFFGEERENWYEEFLRSNVGYMKLRGYYSLIGGLTSIGFIIFYLIYFKTLNLSF